MWEATILRRYHYLVTLAKEKHFGRAAEKCNVSQPALSNSIRQLEKDLGVSIVKRGRRFQGLTREGAKIVEYASKLIDTENSLTQELSLMREGLAGNLKIGVVPSALPMLTLVTFQFCRAYPKVALRVFSKNTTEIERGLDDFSLDLGLTYLDVDPRPRGRTHSIYRQNFWILTPIHGPFEGRDSVTWSEMVEVPLVLLAPETLSRKLINEAFHDLDLEPNPQIQTDSMLNLSAFVRSGYWSSIVPRECFVFCSEPPGTRILPLMDPVVSHDIGLVIPERDPSSVLAQSLFDFAKDIDIEALLV